MGDDIADISFIYYIATHLYGQKRAFKDFCRRELGRWNNVFDSMGRLTGRAEGH